MVFPGKTLARVWALSGTVLGLAAALIGLALIVFSIEHGDDFSESARRAAEGLSGAQRFVSAVTGDVGASSSVLARVAGVARLTSDAVDDTREVLNSTGTALEGLVGASRSAADDLGGLSAMAALAGAGRGVFSETSSGLLSAADAGEDALDGVERLSGRLEEASSAIDSVAVALDSLLAGLERTSSALDEAEAGIESIRDFSEQVAEGRAATTAGIVAGALLLFLGLQQVFLSADLAGIRGRSSRGG